VLEQQLQLAGIKLQAPLCCCLQARECLVNMPTLLLLQAVLEGSLGAPLLKAVRSITRYCCVVYQLLQCLLLAMQQPLLLGLCCRVVVCPVWGMGWWQDLSRGSSFVERRYLCETPQGSMCAEGRQGSSRPAVKQQQASSEAAAVAAATMSDTFW
jgi:hypothetical protein